MMRKTGVGMVLLVLLGASSLTQAGDGHAGVETPNSLGQPTDRVENKANVPARPLGLIGPLGYGEMTFEPPNPVAGQTVQLVVEVGGCQLPRLMSLFDRILVVEGNTLRITIEDYLRPPPPCMGIYFPGEYRFELGSYSSGTYQVELYRRLLEDPTVVDLVQTGQFSVAAAASAMPQPVVIPGVTRWGAGLGMLGISIFALLALRRH